MAACVSPELIYYHKNSATKEVTFIAKGTPGNSVMVYVSKYLGGLVSAHYVPLDSTGSGVLTFKISNGSYEAELE